MALLQCKRCGVVSQTGMTLLGEDLCVKCQNEWDDIYIKSFPATPSWTEYKDAAHKFLNSSPTGDSNAKE